MYQRQYLPASLLVVLLLLFALPADAWWARGHMTVAEIAKRNLKPDVLEKVELAVSSLKELGQFPRSPDMVEVAPWADDLKEMGLYTMSSWHFVNTPYLPDDTFKLDVSPVDAVNVVTIISDLHKAIKDPKTTSDIVVTSIANLIHYVGDLHQPLHSTNLFSTEYPNSDLGGNRIMVFMGEDETLPINLHFFWDSMSEGYAQTDDPRPLSIANRQEITEFADYLEKLYIYSDEDKNVQDPKVMLDESYDLAVNFVYKDIVNGTTLTQDYKDGAKRASEGRVALAGYRLAAILNDALSDVSEQMVGAALQNTEASFQSQPYEPPTKKKGISGGATAGIAVALFVVGVAVSVILSCLLFRACMPHK